jgi:hypothetical protein
LNPTKLQSELSFRRLILIFSFSDHHTYEIGI